MRKLQAGKKGLQTLLKTGFFHVFGSSVLNKIVAFLSSVVLVRILTKSEYGAFTYAWNIYSLILLLNGFGMEYALLQMCSERSADTKFVGRVCNFATRFGLAWDALLMVFLLFLGAFAPLQIESAGPLLQMLCLLPAVQLLFLLFSACLRAQKRNLEYSQITVVNTALVFLISAVCAYVFREKGMVLGYYGAYAVSALLCIFRFRIHLLQGSGRLEAEDRRTLLGIAFVSMCNNGLSQLLSLLGTFVLGILDPQETVLASYRVATLIPSALSFIPISLMTYLYPYFAEHRMDKEWCLRTYKKIIALFGGFNMLVSLGLCILAPFIVAVFFGEIYLDAVPVFRILSVNYFIAGTFRVLAGNLLVTQRKLKFNLIVAVFAGVLNIAANFLFIAQWGPMGAAWATVLVTVLTGAINTSYLIKVFQSKAA